MTTFFLAMSKFPEFQQKAQEEIDRVVGTDRLPDYEDRSKLPYVEALLKETFRWHPIAPIGVPHVTTKDDSCGGYSIPKGAMIIPNIWYVSTPCFVRAQEYDSNSLP
jgi:cytochrome P450